MLRKIRITLAVICFALITLLFLDFTGTLHAWFGWLARIQFLPAVLALNAGVVLALVALTLLLGRVYCSVICPLGVFQDVVSWLGGRGKKRKYRFSYSPARSWLRYGVLGLFVVALVAGIGSFVALLAPYSAYGRIAQNLFAPIYGWGNNLLAYLAERADSYAFYGTDVWMKSLPTFVVAAVTFAVLVVLAWRGGRTYCNTICPVGTVLGLLSKYALLRPVIDKEKCNRCGLCSRRCKASCIDGKEHRIDYSRCVACMDCIETCRHGAISYRLRPAKGTASRKAAADGKRKARATEKGAISRRGFLSGAGLLVASAAARAQEKKVDGGLAVILDRKIPDRSVPIVPPGAQGLRHFAPALHGLSALRLGMSQRRTAPFDGTQDAHAARNVLRTRTLPSRMHQMRRSMSRRRHPQNRRGREIVRTDRPCRVGERQLRAAHRRSGLRQLRPPLSDRSHHDGTVRRGHGGFAEDPRREHRALHRMRSLRTPLPRPAFQRHLCRRTQKPQSHLTRIFLWKRKIRT